jgi:serine/threonine protein kinase
MHKQQIIHGDLTTSNIMRRPDGSLVGALHAVVTVTVLRYSSRSLLALFPWVPGVCSITARFVSE